MKVDDVECGERRGGDNSRRPRRRGSADASLAFAGTWIPRIYRSIRMKGFID
jgi:hypothetical protein